MDPETWHHNQNHAGEVPQSIEQKAVGTGLVWFVGLVIGRSHNPKQK